MVYIREIHPTDGWQVPNNERDGVLIRHHQSMEERVQVGQTLSVLNSDATSHNVHPLPRTNVEWNKSQAAGAGPIEQTFKKPELMIPVKCNLHPWMRAYVNVSDHPFFAVTGDNGSFEIAGLPPGDYTLEAVHERLGNQEIQVTLGDGESKAVELTYSN